LIYLLGLFLALIPDYHIIGPGALSYTTVLEQVAERRIRLGFGLSEIEVGAVLVAPANCRHLGQRGWLLADGIHRVVVVDCENGNHAGQMTARGILADVSREKLGHQAGWLILEGRSENGPGD
jgi:hypothetical protein